MQRSKVAVAALGLITAMDAAFVWLALRPFPQDLAIEAVAVIGLALLAVSCWRLADRSFQRLFLIGWGLTGVVAALRIITGLQVAQPPALLSMIVYNSGFITGAAFAAGAYVDRKGLEAYERARLGAVLAAAGLLLGLLGQYRFMPPLEFAAIMSKMALFWIAVWALDTRRWPRAEGQPGDASPEKAEGSAN